MPSTHPCSHPCQIIPIIRDTVAARINIYKILSSKLSNISSHSDLILGILFVFAPKLYHNTIIIYQKIHKKYFKKDIKYQHYYIKSDLLITSIFYVLRHQDLHQYHSINNCINIISNIFLLLNQFSTFLQVPQGHLLITNTCTN